MIIDDQRTYSTIGYFCVDMIVQLMVQRAFYRKRLVQELLVEVFFGFVDHDAGHASVVKLWGSRGNKGVVRGGEKGGGEMGRGEQRRRGGSRGGKRGWGERGRECRQTERGRERGGGGGGGAEEGGGREVERGREGGLWGGRVREGKWVRVGLYESIDRVVYKGVGYKSGIEGGL